MSKIVIIDDEPLIVNILSLLIQSEFEEVEILTAHCGNEGIQYLKDNSDISIIISDYDMNNGTGGDVYNFNLKSNNIPFLVISAHPLKDFPEMVNFTKDNPLNRDFSKPFEEDEILEYVGELLSLSKTESPYRRVHIKHVIEFSKYFESSLYLRLSDKKFVKLSHKGEQVDKEKLQSLLNKGEQFLYLTTEDFSKISQNLVQSFLKKLHSGAGTAQEWAGSLKFITGFYREFGINEHQIKLVDSVVQHCLSQLKQENIDQALLSPLFKDQGYLVFHSISAIHICTQIMKDSGQPLDDLLPSICYAGLLHDLTLGENHLSAIFDLTDSRFESLNSEEKKCILEHPIEASKLAHNFKCAQTEVSELIRKHHERPQGLGFPLKISAQTGSPLECVFILGLKVADFLFSHELVNEKIDLLISQLEAYSKDNFTVPHSHLLKRLQGIKENSSS